MTFTTTEPTISCEVEAPSTALTYLEIGILNAIDAKAFQATEPFPFLEVQDLLTLGGYQALIRDQPDPRTFSRAFGRRRSHGQKSHDRFVLQYHRLRAIPEGWRNFVRELQGERYRQFVARLLGRDDFILHFHWHYTPRGCSVSPHCDVDWKLGSHIFYLNTPYDWDPAWGGATLALGGRPDLSSRSAPQFDDFPIQIAAHPIGNRSLVFLREERSWHGVRPLRCPDGALRKVFIVEFRKATLVNRVRTTFGF